MTSSVVAIYSQEEGQKKEIYNEDDWSVPRTQDAYGKSKTLAEKAAWDFVNKLPQSEKFELVAINPAIIMGPSYVNNGFAIGELVGDLLNGKFSRMPRVQLSIIDVRDVAKAHLLALKVPEAAGKRFPLSEDSLWFREVAHELNRRLPGFNLNEGELSYCLIKIISWFDSSLKPIVAQWDKPMYFDMSNARNILGMKDVISAEDAVVALAESLIK